MIFQIFSKSKYTSALRCLLLDGRSQASIDILSSFSKHFIDPGFIKK